MFSAYHILLILVTVSGSHNALAEVSLNNVTRNVAYLDAGSDQLPEIIVAREICIKSGIWILYKGTRFNSETPNSQFEIYMRNPTDATMTCYLLPSYFKETVGSFRPVGDTSKPTLNVYVGKNYSKDEVKLQSNLWASVPFEFQSVILVNGGPWEFFLNENFDGDSECSLEGEVFIPDIVARFGVQPGDIRSIALGCTNSKSEMQLNHNHRFNGHESLNQLPVSDFLKTSRRGKPKPKPTIQSQNIELSSEDITLIICIIVTAVVLYIIYLICKNNKN